MVVGVGEGLATDKLTLCFRGVVKPPGDWLQPDPEDEYL